MTDELAAKAEPLTIVTFKWSTPGYRANFESRHVNILRRMVLRHYPDPVRFVCFTDDPVGIEPKIQTHPLWDDHRQVPNPTGGGRPSCYVRLKLWDPAMLELIGPRFVMLDLDTIICGDLRPIFNRTEDVVMWKSPTNEWPYNGAMFMANTGARPQVWNDFDPIKSPALTQAKGYRGSDQAWLSHCMGPNEAVWTARDGVIFQNDVWKRQSRKPSGARIVFTTAGHPPWTARAPWVKEHYR
jgi:hypothetical protein